MRGCEVDLKRRTKPCRLSRAVVAARPAKPSGAQNARLRTRALHGVGLGVGIDRWLVDRGGRFGARRTNCVAVAADGRLGVSARSGSASTRSRGADGAGVSANGAGVGAFIEAAENQIGRAHV